MNSKLYIENLTREEIFSREKKLQIDSDVLLDEYSILNTLSNYGTPHINGSKNLNVIYTKDVDITLYTKLDLMEVWLDLCKDFLRTRDIRRIHPINYYDYDRDANYLEEVHKGFGYFISFDSLKSDKVQNSREWNFEITIINDIKEDAVDKLISNWNNIIDEEKREIILRIKMFITPISTKLKKLGKEKICSADIYKAVLVDGVRSIDEFIDWYEKSETNLDKIKAFRELLVN